MWRVFMMAMMILGAVLVLGCAEQGEEVVAPMTSEGAGSSNQLMVGRTIDGAADEQGKEIADFVVGGLDYEAEYDPPGEPGARISVYWDFDRFEAATGSLTQIDFEELPPGGSSCPSGYWEDEIPNPIELQGVTFLDPDCLETAYCNPCVLGPLELAINPGGHAKFPPETGGVMIALEGMGPIKFQIEGYDQEGGSAIVEARALGFGEVRYVGFTSPNGIERIDFLWTENNGPFGLSSVWFSPLPSQVAEATLP